MSNLGPQRINQSFGDLLQLPNGLTPTIQNVQDGSGNVTPLEISTTVVDFPILSPSGTSGMISDLATDAGSSYIGFLQTGTNAATDLSVQDKGRQVVSILDFLPANIRAQTTSFANAISPLDSYIQPILDAYDYIVFPRGFYAVNNLTFNRDAQQVDFQDAYIKGIATTSTSSVVKFKALQGRYNNFKIYGNYNTNYTSAVNITADAVNDYAGRCLWTNLNIYAALIGVLVGKSTSPIDAPVSENHIIGGEFRDVERCYVVNQPNGFLYVTAQVVDCQKYEWDLYVPGAFSYARSCAAEVQRGWFQSDNTEFLKAQTTNGFLFINGTPSTSGVVYINAGHSECACTHFFGYNNAAFTINGFRCNWFNNATSAFIQVDAGSSGTFVASDLFYPRSSYAATVGLIYTANAEGWFFRFTNCEFQEQNIPALLDSDGNYSTLCDVRFINCYTNDSNYGKLRLETSSTTLKPELLYLPTSAVGSAPPATQYSTTVGGTSILVQTDAGPTFNQCIDLISGAGLNQLFTHPASGYNIQYEQKTGVLEFWQKTVAGANGFNGSIIMYINDSGTLIGTYTVTDGSGGVGNIPFGNTSAIGWKKNQIAIPNFFPKGTQLTFEFRQQSNSQEWKIAGIRFY